VAVPAPAALVRGMTRASDPRTVLTLDAGGTSFAFSAVRGSRIVVEPVSLPAQAHDLDACLANLVEGFRRVLDAGGGRAAAISFAFPGPADYRNGIIGDLGNLPAFRGGVPLGPMLSDRFGLPVFINNDGDLFALGEAQEGFLPWLNAQLAAAGSPRRYRNLLGITLGTGIGAGIVHDGRLFLGDNGAAGEIWLVRNKLDPGTFAEEGASIRAVRRTYAGLVRCAVDDAPSPKEIAAIAAGTQPGDAAAAREAFRCLGEAAGDAVANAVTLVDAPVVIGGGLAGAAQWFLPALVAEANGDFATAAGGSTARLVSRAFNLEDAAELTHFTRGEVRQVRVPGSDRQVPYDPVKRVGVGLSRLGTERAVALGAYAVALDALDAA